MECENVYCVYQNEGKCILEEISIDISGSCSEKIYIDVDADTVQQAKKRLLEVYENERNT